MQLQQDKLWASWVDLAFSKLDSNGDGFIDLDELISNLPVDLENDSDTRNKLLLEVDILRVYGEYVNPQTCVLNRSGVAPFGDVLWRPHLCIW